MQRYFVRYVLAALALVLAVVVLPRSHAAEQQTVPAQKGAAQSDPPKSNREGPAAEALREVIQPLNNAPFWRDVRSGVTNPYQTTQVRGRETNVLIQSEGELWRRVRNGPVTVYGGWLIVLVFAAIMLFYWRRGRIMLHEPRTGRVLIRFSAWERTIHWATAISFVILALSGMLMLFGRYVVLPLFGYTVFSAFAILGKNLHNFVGPLFSVCIVLMFATFVKDNFPQKGDWLWIRKFGGLLTGEHVPSWRFNAAEKAWFWAGVTLLGLISSVTGYILDFPNFGQVRETMQFANVIHATAAALFIALSFGHIYLGTIGMEGAYDTMRHGVADEAWAKEHHEYWYRQVTGRRPDGTPGMTPTTAPAEAMKEGWKL